jgi:predicted nucleotidyltransferase
LREHHRRAIEHLTDKFQNDPRFPALIIGGSLARGEEQEFSDVDIILVASPEEYARRQASKDLWYLDKEICDYPGGYIDGKIVDLAFLQDAALKGSEPARSAFQGAFPAYNHLPELPALLEQIPVFQEQERQEKMARFYSQVQLLNWFVGEAEKRNDPYLMRQSATNLVFFGGRLILEYNRILFPNHKWFMHKLRQAPQKPADLLELAGQLLANPTKELALAFRDTLNNYRDWGLSYLEALVTFVEDTEWNWQAGRPPLGDW